METKNKTDWNFAHRYVLADTSPQRETPEDSLKIKWGKGIKMLQKSLSSSQM